MKLRTSSKLHNIYIEKGPLIPLQAASSKLDIEASRRQIATMKKSQILKIGSRALAAGSIEDLDLARIAQEVGFKPSSLRYYFKNREDLAEAIFHQRIGELESNVEAARDATSLRQMVRMLFCEELDQYAEYLGGRTDRKAQIGEVRTLSKERRARVGARYLALLEKVGAMLKGHGAKPIETLPHLPAQMLIENIFWLPAWIDRFHTWEFGQVCDDITQLFCNGLVGDKASFGADKLTTDAGISSETEDLDEKFLRVATQLVCQRGYRGTSIDAISSALGKTKGSFYHHVSEKKDLVERCFDHGYDRIANFQRAAAGSCDQPLGAVSAVLASIIAAQTEQESPIVRFSALPGLPRSIRLTTIAGSGPIDRWFVAQLARAQANGSVVAVDPYIATQFAVVIANASYDTVWLYRPPAPPKAKRLIHGAIMSGFANPV